MQPSVEQVGTPTSAFRVFVLALHFYVLRLISFDISELLSRQLLSKRSYPAYFKLYHLLCWQGVRRKATSIVAWLRLLQDHGAADKSSQAVSCFETLGKSGLVAGKLFRYLWLQSLIPLTIVVLITQYLRFVFSTYATSIEPRFRFLSHATLYGVSSIRRSYFPSQARIRVQDCRITCKLCGTFSLCRKSLWSLHAFSSRVLVWLPALGGRLFSGHDRGNGGNHCRSLVSSFYTSPFHTPWT